MEVGGLFVDVRRLSRSCERVNWRSAFRRSLFLNIHEGRTVRMARNRIFLSHATNRVVGRSGFGVVSAFLSDTP